MGLLESSEGAVRVETGRFLRYAPGSATSAMYRNRYCWVTTP